jgi:signal transduction histidine kinase
MKNHPSNEPKSSLIGDAQLFEVIAGEAIIGIMAFDAQTKVCVYTNRLARETLELSFPIDQEGQIATASIRLSDLFPVGVRSNSALAFSEEMLMTEGLVQNVLINKRDRQVFLANVSFKHMMENGLVTRYLVMFQDITLQRKMQRDLEAKQDEIHNAYAQVVEQNRQLLALDSAKDRFIALTTHELRTPLSAIVATAEVLQLKLYESDVQKEELIETIHEQGMELMELVNDILDFAKIRAGKMEFFVEKFDLVPVVSKLMTTFEQMAAKSNVTLAIEKPNFDFSAYSDSLRLKEVVNNVVNNAIKYNRSGGTVKLSFSKIESGFVRITVADTGLGIAASKLHHVFNEFETIGHVSGHHKGTGLGMPISKRLMEAMGGLLSLESVEGVGTSFFIDVPVDKVLAEEFYRTRADTLGDLAA